MVKRLAVAIALAAAFLVPSPWSMPDLAGPGPDEEDARLRSHFDGVLRHLAARDVSDLDAGHVDARRKNLDRLAFYARRGAFPRNRHTSKQVPIFIDEAGTRCAMAFLIEASGNEALVARVAGSNNEAFMRDLRDDRDLGNWLVGAGLTLAEAGLIQPAYRGNIRYEEVDSNVPTESVMNTTFLLAAAFGVPSVYLNGQRDRPWQNRKSNAAMGLMTSATLLTVGVQDWVHDSHLRWQGYLALTVGAMSGAMSIWNLSSGPREGTVSRGNSEGRIGVRMGPLGEPQVALHVRF